MTIDQLLAHPYSSAAVAVLTAAVVALLRWRFPERWAALPKRVQVLPVLLVAAILSATKGGVQAALLATQEIGVELVPFLSQWATDSVLGWLGSMGTQQAAKRALPEAAPPDPPGTVTRITLPSPKDSKAPPMGPLGATIVLLLAGCSASTADRQLCYARADAEFAAAVAACPGPWESCPDREAILAAARKADEACP